MPEAEDAATVLASAVEDRLAADTGAFDQGLNVSGKGLVRVHGEYDLSASSSAYDIVATPPDQPLARLQVTAFDGVVYVFSEDWRTSDPCWMRLRQPRLERLTGLDLPFQDSGKPTAVLALETATGIRADVDDPDLVIGSVDLPSVVGMFGGELLQYAVDQPAWETSDRDVVARFLVRDGELDGYAVDGSDVSSVMVGAGLFGRAYSDNVPTPRGNRLRAALGTTDVVVNFRSDGDEVSIVRPQACPG